jgi:hypothetical protein
MADKGIIVRIYSVIQDPPGTFILTADVAYTNGGDDKIGDEVEVSAGSYNPLVDLLTPSSTSGTWRQRLASALVFKANDQYNLTVDQVLGPDGTLITPIGDT